MGIFLIGLIALLLFVVSMFDCKIDYELRINENHHNAVIDGNESMPKTNDNTSNVLVLSLN
jgi:hypothetical protein